jgi:hypothetical protein
MYKKYDKIKYLLREIYYNKDENIIPFTPVSSPTSSPILSPTSSPPLSPILSDFSLLKNDKEPLLMINKDILMEYIVLAYLFSISLFMQILKSLFI